MPISIPDWKGMIAYEHAEAYGHEQQGFEIFLDREPEEEASDRKHYQVRVFAVGETCEIPESP